MDRLGLVGLPNSGKSALFNALTGGQATVAPHPFSTTESEIGVGHVPDERLDALAELSKSRKVVQAAFEVVDIAGVQKSGEHGSGTDGLGTKFLSGVREVDALCYVLRSFEDESVPGETDPEAALEVLELELVLADSATLESQLAKKRKPGSVEPTFQAALDAAPAALDVLHGGTPLYRSSLTATRREALRPLFLLTNKAVLAVVNTGEDAAASPATEALAERLSGSTGRAGRGPGGLGPTGGGGGAARPGGAGRAAGGPRPRRRCPRPGGTGRLCHLGQKHVSHHGREGVAGMDLPGGSQGA